METKGRIVPREELPEWCQFQASLSDHPIILAEEGSHHFRYLKTIDYEGYDLNKMAVQYARGELSREYMMQFYRDIGYSLGGYEEVWGDELSEMQRQQAYDEPIDTLLAKWEGKDIVPILEEIAEVLIPIDGIEQVDLCDVIKIIRITAHKIAFPDPR